MADKQNLRATARALYEAGRLTVKQVAAEIGTSSRTVERWAAVAGWKRTQITPELTERAHRVASTLAKAPEKSLDQVIEDEAVDLRAELITRHRTEWRLIGGLINESMKNRDIERAKLTEVLARSTKLKQDGERRAYGIDSGPDNATKIQVVIERE
ncbi:hypothetical protein [Aeromonas salmonicida]|uniref:hypothetical protein n=1 Tax=Aeromonas salmonicida TaxID=645 RepID=UPI0021165F6F|nr:hypothetical protein [Aeromonas salmonicida]UUI59693.1 hypothetical protein NP805_16125 [Aeromonas salmonicida]